MFDCHKDSDCPGGYWCAITEDPHQLCGAAMQNAQVCGTVPMCKVDSDCGGAGATCSAGKCSCVNAMAPDGTTYMAGEWCTLRNVCRPRRICDPCTTDIDCSGLPDQKQHCTTMPKDGMKFCATDCMTDSDCDASFQCTNNACVPRYGTCTGAKAFCEPCHNDTECAKGLRCERPSGASTVERACLDPAGATSCMSDLGCPTSPSGLHAACLGPTENVPQGQPGFDTCYAPFNTGTLRFSCWPSNKGEGCYKASECISKMCVGANAAQMQPGTCQ
jgi:hypothetical protein